MFVLFLKSALRKISNHKLYSAISILSLAIGLTTAILIFAFVRYESSFDSMHPDSNNTYRVNWSNVGTEARFATFFNVLTPVLDEGMQEIEAFTRLARREHLLTVDGVDQFATVSL